jgi:hypothetical protein
MIIVLFFNGTYFMREYGCSQYEGSVRLNTY